MEFYFSFSLVAFCVDCIVFSVKISLQIKSILSLSLCAVCAVCVLKVAYSF